MAVDHVSETQEYWGQYWSPCRSSYFYTSYLNKMWLARVTILNTMGNKFLLFGRVLFREKINLKITRYLKTTLACMASWPISLSFRCLVMMKGRNLSTRSRRSRVLQRFHIDWNKFTAENTAEITSNSSWSLQRWMNGVFLWKQWTDGSLEAWKPNVKMIPFSGACRNVGFKDWLHSGIFW